MGRWKAPEVGLLLSFQQMPSAIIFQSRKRKEVQGRLQADPDVCLGPASLLHMPAKVVPGPALKRQKMLLLAVVPQLLQGITKGHEQSELQNPAVSREVGRAAPKGIPL